MYQREGYENATPSTYYRPGPEDGPSISFSLEDVKGAVKECNFNKGLGPDGFCGSILKPDQDSHQPTTRILGQLREMLNDPDTIPHYLREGRLIPLSKNKGKDIAALKDIRPIVVRSHLAKILEKATLAKIESTAPHLLATK